MIGGYRLWLSLALLLIAGRLLFPAFSGVRLLQSQNDERQEVIYVCSETGAAFSLRSKASPEKNPETGRLTLLPGLYCETCHAWKSCPSWQILQHNPSARICSMHKTLMTFNGPLEKSSTTDGHAVMGMPTRPESGFIHVRLLSLTRNV